MSAVLLSAGLVGMLMAPWSYPGQGVEAAAFPRTDLLRLAYWDGYSGKYPYPVAPLDESIRARIVAEQIREMEVMRSAFDGFVLNMNLLYPLDYDGHQAPSIARLEPLLSAAARRKMKVVLEIGNKYTPLSGSTYWHNYFQALVPLENEEAVVGWKIEDEAGSYGARMSATRTEWQAYFRLAREHFRKPIGIDVLPYYFVDRILPREARNEVYRRGLLGGFPRNQAAAALHMDIEDITEYLRVLDFIMFAPIRPFISDEEVLRDARNRWGDRLQAAFTRGGLYYTYMRKDGQRVVPKAEFDPERTSSKIADQYRQVTAAGGTGVVLYTWNFTYDLRSHDTIRIDRIPGYPDSVVTPLLKAYQMAVRPSSPR